MSKPINVYSEIGPLKTVVVHRPGKELENLMPDHLDRLLFDDIPFLADAQKEHDQFKEVLEEKGIEVLYLEDLATEALTDNLIKEAFIDEYLSEANIETIEETNEIRQLLEKLPTNRELIDKTIEGVRREELTSLAGVKFENDYPFAIDPMPNLYFTRDPFATIGSGVSINRMYATTRRRETIYGNYIFTYHPRFKEDVPMLYGRDQATSIEGGDILVLSKEVLAIGISQRTDLESIKRLSRTIFASDQGFNRVLGIDIGRERKFMHLDTVFTMIDHDKFTIHPEIEANLKVYTITQAGDDISVTEERESLENLLASYLKLDNVQLIPCAGGNITDAAREQWNDGTNTLTIAPGEVVVYNRNTVTNKKLREAGIKVHEIPGSELVRGRGGPRCMSMPIYREEI